MIERIREYLNDFVKFVIEEKVEIYNEFSMQHELGIYLRECFKGTGYKIQFERNVSYFGIDKSKLIKKEIDLSIFDSEMNEKYAIELKYPMNGQYPETMYSFVKDIRFCEQLTQSGFNGAFSFSIINDRLFYEGAMTKGIYSYSRGSNTIKGSISKPTGRIADEIILSHEYAIIWNEMTDTSRYYIVTAEREVTELIMNQLVEELISKRIYKYTITNNLGIQRIKEYIRKSLLEAKYKGIKQIEFISGNLHQELSLLNAMPSVCAAMIKVMEDYPESELIKPDTVKQFSSTIKVKYKLI